MSTLVTMRKLLESGSHFGHQTRRWNPKMKSYVYTSKAGTHIIDLNQTLDAIETAYAKMREIGEKNGKVLFVGTKKQAQTIVLDEALRSGSFFINQRWLGGLLTNFRTIQKSIRRLLEIEAMETNGSINVYPKKEIIQLRKEATRLETFLGGIKEMKKLPDAVFVVDPTEDLIPVLEARKLGIPVFGIMDTNSDPDMLDYGIPANDDAVRSVRLLVGLMADALIEAKGGVLSYAYQQDEEEKDISMIDVIINVERQNEENDRRRRQRNEERRQRQERRKNYKGNRDNTRDNRDNRSYASRSENKTESTENKSEASEADKVKKTATEKTEAVKKTNTQEVSE
jgi:small subunit ribosomal protein S2